jgi:hypothetical protein
MNYSEYQDFIVRQINEETGLDLVWEDFTLSNPIPVSGKTIEVTITPTEQGSTKVKGEAKFKIDRMDLTNAVFVFDWKRDSASSVIANKVFGAALSVHDRSPKTLPDVLEMLMELTGIPLLEDDFESLTVTPDAATDVVFTLTAKASSMYYFGTLTVKLTHPWITHVKFRNSLGNDIQVTAAQIGYGSLFVDGVRVTLPYALKAGQHDIEIYHFSNISGGLKFLGPTHLTSMGLFFDKFDGLFADCFNLQTIDPSCIRLNGSNLQATNIFKGCSGLTTLPSKLFGKNCEAYNIDGFLRGSGITSVGANLFEDLSVLGPSLSDVFNGCSKLTTVANGAIDPIVINTITSSGLFANTGLTQIPVGLLSKMVKVTTLDNTFFGCTALKEIPANLLDKLVSVANSGYLFRDCKALTSIPKDLFKPLTALRTLTGTFRGCTGITAVDADIIRYNVDLVQITEIFSGSGLLVIPPTLLEANPNLVHLTSAFSGTPIKTIPADLFKNNPVIAVLTSIFDNCVSLTEIPATLFAQNTTLRDVSSAFRNVPAKFAVPDNFFPGTQLARAGSVFRNSGIVSIPSRLFALHKGLTELQYAFAGTKLTTVPTYLVLVDSGLRDVSYMFDGCSELVSIANDALRFGFVAATNQVGNCAGFLRNCSKLTTLGNAAVRINGYVWNFDSFMEGCVSLRIRDTDLVKSVIFNHNTPTTTTMSFIGMFQNCKWLEGTCDYLWKAVVSGGVPGNARKNTNFIERCFLLDDYVAVGKPWWTTPLNLSLATGDLPVFELDDVSHGIASYIPLYSTYYCNVPREIMSGISNATNLPVTGINRQRLASLFFAAGLDLPAEAATCSIMVLDTNMPGVALRPEVKIALLIRLNGAFDGTAAQEVRNPNNYLFCSITS